MTSRRRKLAAAEAFVATWRELLAEDLVDSYKCTLTCPEAEAAADLYRAFGDQRTAENLLAAHALADDRGDAHYRSAAP